MRSVLLATSVVAFPLAAFAQSHCALPGPVSMTARPSSMIAEPSIKLPPPVTVGGPPVPLMPTPTPTPAPIVATAKPAATVTDAGQPKPSVGDAGLRVMTSADIQAIPALVHIAAAGATLSDLGTSHGLRTVYARNGAQVMVFEVDTGWSGDRCRADDRSLRRAAEGDGRPGRDRTGSRSMDCGRCSCTMARNSRSSMRARTMNASSRA